MPIRNTAYETTACNGFVINKTIRAIEETLVNGNFSNGKNSTIKEINRTPSISPVPAFMHPIVINDPIKDRPVSEDMKEIPNKLVFVDVRSSGKFDDMNFSFKIRNPYEYDFITLYGELNHFWVNDNPKLLSAVSFLPVSLYAKWISENISRRFGLNPQDQLSIAILAAFFYLGQFTNDEAPDIRELQRICGIIGKSVYVNAEAVLAIIDKMNYITNIAEFCTIAKDVTGNVRLEGLNPGILMSILGNTWYGTNHVELTAVALEFPPAWILLTYTSYMDRSYKNTGIAKMSVRDKKTDIDSFVKSLVTLIRQQ